MPLPSRFSSSILSSLLLGAGSQLGSCSQQAPATTAAAPAGESAPTKPVAAFPYGAKIDSLNGVAGHTFGQPLSAFPKLEMYAVEPGEATRTYHPPAGTTGNWFAKHRREVPYQYYDFLDGQFYRFRAVGEPATLRAEADFLFGPGQQQGPQVFWDGERARAVYSEQARGLGREGTLHIVSKPLEAALAAKARAKLQADNAQ